MDKLIIGCDHGGFFLKKELIEYLQKSGFDCIDVGTFDTASVDYPDYASKVCEKVLSEKGTKGILICGTGLGMSIAANKFNGIRAAVCTDEYMAEYTRRHNDANVLCLGARVIGPGLAVSITDVFLKTDFEGGRHTRRLDKIREIESNN